MNNNIYEIVLGNLERWNPCGICGDSGGRYEEMARKIAGQLGSDSSIDDISWNMNRVLSACAGTDRNRCNEYATYIWIRMQAACG